MKKLVMLLVVLLLAASVAAADGLTHYESRCGFAFDYPSDLLHVDGYARNTMLFPVNIADKMNITITYSEDDQIDVQAELLAFGELYDVLMTADELGRIETGCGTAYTLRVNLDDSFNQVYMLKTEDGHLVDVGVYINYNQEDAYLPVVEDIVRSLTYDANADHSGYADEEEVEWEEEFYDAMFDAYADVLTLYGTAVCEGWDIDTMYDYDLCPLLAHVEEPGKVASQIRIEFVSLANDDRYELILCTDAEDGKGVDVLAIYTRDENDMPKPLVISEERSRYSLRGNAEAGFIIANHGSASAFESGWFFYQADADRNLHLLQAIMFVAQDENTHAWYLATDDDWDVTNDTPITDEEAEAIIASYAYPTDEDLNSYTFLSDFIQYDMGIDLGVE